MTKKKTLPEKIFFTLFVFSLILIFVFIYFFPAVKKINRLKRDIKETSLKVTDLETEKSFFVGSDQRELKILKNIKNILEKKLPEATNLEISKTVLTKIGNLIKRENDVIKISGLTIEEKSFEFKKTDDKFNRSFINGMYILPVTISFNSGLNSASELIKSLISSEFYIIPKKLTASKIGENFRIVVDAEVYFKGPKFGESTISFNPELNGFVDMDSPSLQKPVYLSPIKTYFTQKNRFAGKRR